jgi:acetyl-CoA acetyltransferase
MWPGVETIHMRSAAIAGTGLTDFGVHDRSTRDLFAEAGVRALEDAGVPSDDIEAFYYGNFIGEVAERQGHQGPLMAESVGLSCPVTRLESACASSGVAVRQGVKEIRGGAGAVLVGGAERMTNMSTTRATEGLATAADDLYEVRAGVTFPGAYALIASAYFSELGGCREDLAHIAVKNHENALANEHAHLQESISVEDVLDAPSVAKPLGLYDACPISDGAAALVLVSDEYARANGIDAPVTISGTGQASDRLALQDRASLTETPATATAAAEAYNDASIEPADIDCAEVHDCFTIAEALATEGLGLHDRGDGIVAAHRGESLRDGEVPINLSGGLKAKGHPVGATGAAQIAELARQLDGSHPRAPSEARVGVAHNAGGTVASATVHVLEGPK